MMNNSFQSIFTKEIVEHKTEVKSPQMEEIQVNIWSVVMMFPEWCFPAQAGHITAICRWVLHQSTSRLLAVNIWAFIVHVDRSLCYMSFSICTMTDFHEQCVCIKFCFKLCKTAVKAYKMMKSGIPPDQKRPGRSRTSSQCWSSFMTRRESSTMSLFLLV